MAGLQEPQSGSLRLGGHPLVNLPDGQLWEWVGLMEQQVALFDASILENIRLAKEDASIREVEEALDKAHLTAFVASLPAGLATQVGESGLQLSHGQARRVALARLFLKNPPVVLLDEPTAGLDAHAEALVLDAVDELARDKTLLIVTHRPAVLERFARSYQLVEGKVYPL
jgi:ABC-type transport system involved in cytochrome bd biosynthesis fused ATPase/permease subunit